MKISKLIKLLVVSPLALFYLFGLKMPSVAISRSAGDGTGALATKYELMWAVFLANPLELIFTSNMLSWFDSFYMMPWFANPAIVVSMLFLFTSRYRISVLFAVISCLFAASFIISPHYFNVFEGLFQPAVPLAGYYVWLIALCFYCAFLIVFYWLVAGVSSKLS